MTEPAPITFNRFGRSYHLVIETAADLETLITLTRPLWVATSAPIDTITCDRTFLELVDSDHNGRILAYEMRVAVRWLLDTLGDHHGINEHSDVLRLEDINTTTDEGDRIRQSAQKMLATLGTPDARR
ncbi:MAG TPA: hypothetical protein VMX57_03725, partial [Planctomycetota bacterium]|nr:hypothetical protein [Planctomycetota bacterium]